TDPDDAAIITAIIAMAHSLNLRVVAEGVETEAQRAFLKAHACDEFQGFLFGHPVGAAEFARAMEEAAAAQKSPDTLLLDRLLPRCSNGPRISHRMDHCVGRSLENILERLTVGLKREVGHGDVVEESKGMGHPYAAYRTWSVRCCCVCVSESRILKFEQLGKVGEIPAAILRH
ncbi:MAG: EAL domain-containing protein, partial [Nitrospiraceae bacterium]|nr:EAL domain-containing protein [Nitrospiraceae bacterium]